MGKSYAARYQIGHTYKIKNIYYFVFSTSSGEIGCGWTQLYKRAREKGFLDVIVKRDKGHFALLVPVAPVDWIAPSHTQKTLAIMKQYEGNRIKLGLPGVG